jgi:hypothetical protein
MARIRSIKPEFCSSEAIVALSIPCRLHFAMLWTYADDQGRGHDNPRLIKAALWPLDDDVTAADVEGWQAELEAHGRITRYGAEGRRYFAVTNFKEHQKPSKPNPSKLPEPPPPTDGPLPDNSGRSPGAVRDVDIPNGEKSQVNGKNGTLPEDSRSATGALPLGVVDGEGEGVGGEREGSSRQSAVTATRAGQGAEDDDDWALRQLTAAAVILGDRDHERRLAAVRPGLEPIGDRDAHRTACIDRRVADTRLHELVVRHPDWTPQAIADAVEPPAPLVAPTLTLVPAPPAIYEPGPPVEAASDEERRAAIAATRGTLRRGDAS